MVSLSDYKGTNLIKGFVENDQLEKGKGEGSRGGKVIGHTKSGKAIYENADHASHREFSKEDHKDAVDAHNKLMKTDKGNETTHYNQISRHEEISSSKKEKEEGEGSFKHHRLMAGYHSVKEKQLSDRVQDLQSSSDPSLRKTAAIFDLQRQAHADEEAKHAKKAKELHDPKKHGHWNTSLPTSEEALKYQEQYRLKKSQDSPKKADKIKKVMEEFKAGKLKSSSGEVVTDRKQAIAIALSEAGQSMEKGKEEMIAEHERLVNVLESDSHEDDKKESKKQAKELEDLKNN